MKITFTFGRIVPGQRKPVILHQHSIETRPCTCHPDDNPPRPCPQRYALSECRAAADSPHARETL